MDRFGRIAFNKNRELSQASLDVVKDAESVSLERKIEEQKAI